MVKQIISKFVLRTGYSLKRNVKAQDFSKLIARLRPINFGYDLVRIGSETDGGYLMPDDFEGISSCLSLGVSDLWDFEKDLYSKFGIPSFMFDGSVEAPPNLGVEHNFFKYHVGPSSESAVRSISDILQCEMAGQKGDLILQMDIEGAEYLVLASLSEKERLRFRTIVIEFHNFHEFILAQNFEFFEKVMSNFAITHYPAHYHANNASGSFKFGKIMDFPKTFEMTFHRKDRALNDSTFSEVPHPLDADNVEIVFQKFFNFG